MVTKEQPKILEDLLKARFPEEEHRSFKGRGGMDLTYIEDETLMERLDDVLGAGNWGTAVEVVDVGLGIVKVVLRGHLPGEDGPYFTYEDFGYPTNPGGEALKEAVTDGFRRVVRYLGPGRYVYAGEVPAKPTPAARPPKAQAVPQSNSSTTTVATADVRVSSLIGKPVAHPANQKQKALLFATAHEKGFTDDDLKTLVLNVTGKHSSKDLTTTDIDALLDFLREVASKVQEAE